MDRQKHLYHMSETAEEIVGLIEQAVSQTCSDEYAQKTVDEQRVEKFILDFLLFVKFFYNKIGEKAPILNAVSFGFHLMKSGRIAVEQKDVVIVSNMV